MNDLALPMSAEPTRDETREAWPLRPPLRPDSLPEIPAYLLAGALAQSQMHPAGHSKKQHAALPVAAFAFAPPEVAAAPVSPKRWRRNVQ